MVYQRILLLNQFQSFDVGQCTSKAVLNLENSFEFNKPNLMESSNFNSRPSTAEFELDLYFLVGLVFNFFPSFLDESKFYTIKFKFIF